jgi:hypothetical protein
MITERGLDIKEVEADVHVDKLFKSLEEQFLGKRSEDYVAGTIERDIGGETEIETQPEEL